MTFDIGGCDTGSVKGGLSQGRCDRRNAFCGVDGAKENVRYGFLVAVRWYDGTMVRWYDGMMVYYDDVILFTLETRHLQDIFTGSTPEEI